MEEVVIEDSSGESPLENGLLTKNVDTFESVELSPCLHKSGADNDLNLLSVFSVSLSSASVYCWFTIKISASTVYSLCLKCLNSMSKIECLYCNKLLQCSIRTDLNKLCMGIV